MKVRFTQHADPVAGTSPRRLTLVALAAAGLAVLLCILLAAPANADDDDDDGGEYVPRQVVVELKPEAKIGAINRKYGTRTISRLPGGGKIYLLRTPRGSNPVTLADRIAKDTRVVFAEPNFRTGSPEGSRQHRARPGGTPNPTSTQEQYNAQYAITALGLSQAHTINKGGGSVVAVIDTGVQTNHPGFSGKITAGYDFIGGDTNPQDVGNGVDEDRDGVKDEMVGHGTHVAGIVALTAPGAKIMPVRALDSEGRGNVFVLAKAIRYAVRNGADVVNLSLGSSRESELLEELLEGDDDDSAGQGTVFVAAAGNDNNSVPQYPAAEEDTIAVTSVNSQEKKSGFANYGGWVTIAAPGDNVHSPFPLNKYAAWSGTSMATPFVAGQAALARSLRPSVDPECVIAIIRTTVRSLNASNPDYINKLGSGHADIGASTQYAASTSPCPVTDDD